MEERDYLIHYAIKYAGNYQKILKAYYNKEKVYDLRKDVFTVTILDKEYPSILRELEYPPLVLFYRGNLKLLDNPMLSIVGSRIPNKYGVDMTFKIVSEIAYKYTIVSGMAIGIDTLSHSYAINSNTIAVLGSGIDYCYPKSNVELYQHLLKKHLIISEYPAMTSPNKQHFPWRNRIIAALGEKLIVVQAKIKSGTMHTVNEALKINRDVYVIPHQIDDEYGEGNNLLIQQGANILLTEDISML